MAFLEGVTAPVMYAPGAGTYSDGAVAAGSPTTHLTAVIDGTPIRVVVIALSAAAGLVALHWAGFRFSLGVSA